MTVRSFCALVAGGLALLAAAAPSRADNANIKFKAVYRDAGRHSNWVDQDTAQMIADYFKSKGYEVLDGTTIRKWIDARIADRERSVLISSHDTLPDEALDPEADTAAPLRDNPMRRYLLTGGRFLSPGDIPFYLHAADDTRMETGWADNGALTILGWNNSPNSGVAARDTGVAPTVTDAGKAWGLTQETMVNSIRPALPSDVDIALSTDADGGVGSWIRCYTNYPGRGDMIRLWDYDMSPDNITDQLLKEFQAAAEYDVPSQKNGPLGASEITGVLTDDAGKGIANTNIKITGGPNAVKGILASTDKDGKFFAFVQPGTYNVGLGGSYLGDPTSASATVADGKATAVTLKKVKDLDISSDAGQKWEIKLPATDDNTMPKDDPKAIPAAPGFQEFNVPTDWNELDADDNIYGWYRTKVTLPDSYVGHDLGFGNWNLDDEDWTYFNGELIGHTNQWDSVRHYLVPARLVQKNNDIVILGRDGGGGGGFNIAADVPLLTLLNSGAEVSGTVKDQSGKPAANVTVTISGNGSFGPQNVTAVTDANGKYDVPGVGAGTLSVGSSGGVYGTTHPAAANLALVSGKVTTQDITIQRPMTMSLRAADLKAAGLPGWSFLQMQSGDTATIETATNDAGNPIPDPKVLAKFCDPTASSTGPSTIVPGTTWLQDWTLVPGDAGDLGRAGDPQGIPDNAYWVQSVKFKVTGDMAKSKSFAVAEFNSDDRIAIACVNGTRLYGYLDAQWDVWNVNRQFPIPDGVVKTDGTDNVFTIVGYEGGGGAGHNIDEGGPFVIGMGAGVAPVVKGDLNGDSKVNIGDATLALQISVGNITPSAAQTAAGDVINVGDGIKIGDVIKILQVAVGNGSF